MVVVLSSTFFFERAIDVTAEKFFDSYNQGVNIHL